MVHGDAFEATCLVGFNSLTRCLAIGMNKVVDSAAMLRNPLF